MAVGNTRYATLLSVCLTLSLESSSQFSPSTLFQSPSPSVPDLPVHAPTTSCHSVNSLFSPSITPSLFHFRLKTYVFHKSFPP